MATRAWLSLGSNMGDRKAQLMFAVEQLNALEQAKVVKKSSIYLAEPWGKKDQDDFYNAVVEVETTYLPWELLSQCQAIEQAAGRERKIEWGPRILDIDLLVYDRQSIETGDLRIPHPYLRERLFVLIPLSELDPNLDIPLVGRLNLLLAACDSDERVTKIFEPDQW